MKTPRFLLVLPLAAMAVVCRAQTTPFPGAPIALSALNSAGSSFTYNGVLNGNTLLAVNVSSTVCLQEGAYCTNGAGVVTVAGSSSIGQATSFTDGRGTFNYGSLLMTISGVGTVQLFPANAANGLGSGSPSTTLSFSGRSLSSVGFGQFSTTNPTITLVVADNNFPDNSGTFQVSGSFTPAAGAAPVPALSDAGLVLMALLLLAASATMLRSQPTRA
jgi:hypothetical protein